MGRAARYARGRHALAQCPRCGEVVGYHDLVFERRKGEYVCGECWDPKALDDLPVPSVADAEALHHPRPINAAETVVVPIDRLAWPLYLWPGDLGHEVRQNLSGAALTITAGTLLVDVIQPVSGAEAAFTAGDIGEIVGAFGLTGAETAFATDALDPSGAVELTTVEYLEDGTGAVITDDAGNPILGSDTALHLDAGAVAAATA